MNFQKRVAGGSYHTPAIKELTVCIETGFAGSGIETGGIGETPGEWD